MIQITGGRVVTPRSTIAAGTVELHDGRIVHVGRHRRSSGSDVVRNVDATDRIVIPGLIDLHGDDLESHVFPRPNAEIEPARALIAADRANLQHGITTKFHALAFEDAPEANRTIETATSMAEAIEQGDQLLGDNRVHVRCELADVSGEAIEDILGGFTVDLVSVMHHSPGGGQYGDVAAFEDGYGGRIPGETGDVDQLIARRSADTPGGYGSTARRLSGVAAKRGIVLASHDDEAASRVERMAAIGATVCEYPVALEAARRASELGQVTVMGAPNLVNGGSLWGNLSAERARRAGVLDVLCSDYHPPSMLASIFVETGEPLHRRVNRVTKAPAEAVGLDDRGRLQAGSRADVAIVDPLPYPTVERVFVAGRERLRAGRSP